MANVQRPTSSNGTRASWSLDRLIDKAARAISRLDPAEAFSAAAADGVIVDIRSQDARVRDGVIPRSMHIPRTVLEWRVAVDSRWRNPPQ